LGDAVTCEAVFKKNGVELDPTTVTFKVENPSGVQTIYVYGTNVELIRDSTGVYHVDVNANTVGTWLYRFESTGTGQAAQEGTFRVRKSNFS
jgi:uncharacterized protein YfaS (alpha-2-macroglobulin family)